MSEVAPDLLVIQIQIQAVWIPTLKLADMIDDLLVW